jgi:hypothetical protein
MKAATMLGAAALALVGLGYASLLVALRRADRPEPIWWYGYARDGVNLVGFVAFSCGFALAGLSGPHAMLAGASLTLAGYGLDYLLAARPALSRVLLVVVAALAGALREPLDRGLRALVRGVF